MPSSSLLVFSKSDSKRAAESPSYRLRNAQTQQPVGVVGITSPLTIATAARYPAPRVRRIEVDERFGQGGSPGLPPSDTRESPPPVRGRSAAWG